MMEVTLELYDLVVMHSKYIMFYIFHLKKLATGLPVVKTWIEYNNSSEENYEEEKEPIDIEFTEIKWPWNDKNAIDFSWSDVQQEDDEDITLANFIENY